MCRKKLFTPFFLLALVTAGLQGLPHSGPGKNPAVEKTPVEKAPVTDGHAKPLPVQEINLTVFSNYLYRENFFYRGLLQNENLFLVGKNLSGSIRASFETGGIFLKDADLHLHSSFTDKQGLLFDSCNLLFMLRYESWLETVVSVHYGEYLGSKDDDLGYLQPLRPGRKPANPGFYLGVFFTRFLLADSSALRVELSLGRQWLKDTYLVEGIFENFLYPVKFDGVYLTIQNNLMGKFQILAADILQLYQNWNNEPAGYKNLSQDSPEIIANYDGDLLSFRSGIFYETPSLITAPGGVKWAIYLNTLFTRYGPVTSGVDRAGFSGAFADNDYLLHYGIGSFFKAPGLALFFEFCRSEGIDRQMPGLFGDTRDIETNGNFFRASLLALLPPLTPLLPIKNTNHAVHVNLIFSEGPVFDNYGNQKTYGFVSPGNHDFGGFLLNQVWGFRPYALSLNNGFANNRSYGFYHASGILAAGLAYTLLLSAHANIQFQSWFLFDASLDATENIFQKSANFENFFDRHIGNETMVTLFSTINRVVEMSLSFDVFAPGGLYQSFNHGIYGDKKDFFYGLYFDLKIRF